MIVNTLFPSQRSQLLHAATTMLTLLAAATTDPKVKALIEQWVQALAQSLVDARTNHRAKQGVWRARYDELAPLNDAADAALRFAEAAIKKKLGAAGVALFHRLLGVGKLSDVTGAPLARQHSLVEDLRARVEAEPDVHKLPAERLEEVFTTNAALGAGVLAEQDAKRAWKAASSALDDVEDSFHDCYRVLVKSIVQLLGEDGARAILQMFTRSERDPSVTPGEPSVQLADEDDDEG